MKLNYLSADTRLSKTYEEIAPGNYKETSYPPVFRFTSIERDLSTLEEFELHTVAAADTGMCLLKGQLDAPILDESRAGHTDATAQTEWICLDIDYTVTGLTPEDFLDEISPALDDVSFLFQHSASQGIKNSDGWRGHFFILLDRPMSPQALKQWLISLNLDIPLLREQISLSASGGALIYPLDVTTCQNDKLIFIAPPVCTGFKDPVESRFLLVHRQRSHLHLDLTGVSAASNKAKQLALITKLREKSGLEKKQFKLISHYDSEIITNPDPVTVTSKKEERGFVYLNLNNGDSWGYYFPADKPDILYNFKGEPCMYMQDVDKDIYNEYSQQKQHTEGSVPFAFLQIDNDTYYRGFANPETKVLDWVQPIGSKPKIKDFYTMHGVAVSPGWSVDEWRSVFDPTTEGYADFQKREINTYKKTEYITDAATTNNRSTIPPVIDRILTSVCVDDENKEHFLNWLACIFQRREKTNTAWIFQGVQGTGKGVLFTHVILPLIGRDYCHEMTMDRLDDDFNAYLSENIVLFIDEAKISDSKNGDRLLNRIKNLITEPEQHIRGMRQNAVTRDNYSNIILASNYDDIIPMEASDRRFNVAPRQETPLPLEYEDVVRIKAELPQFASYLHSHEASMQKARRVLLSDAREKLIELSQTTVEAFFRAIKKGELEYFTQYLDHGIKSDLEGMRYHDYALTVKRWLSVANSVTNVSRGELQLVYQYLQNTSIAATKFSRMAAKYNIHMVPVRVDGELLRGIKDMVWHMDETDVALHKESEETNVVRMRK